MQGPQGVQGPQGIQGPAGAGGSLAEQVITLNASDCQSAAAPCTIALTTGRMARITGYNSPTIYVNKLTIGGGAPTDGTMAVLYFSALPGGASETGASVYLVDSAGSTSPVATGGGNQGFLTTSPFGQASINGTGSATLVYSSALAKWLIIAVRN